MVQLQVAGTEDLPSLLGRAAGWGWQAASSSAPAPRHEAHCHTRQQRRAGKEKHCHVHCAGHADSRLALHLQDLPGPFQLGAQNSPGKGTAAEIAVHGR